MESNGDKFATFDYFMEDCHSIFQNALKYLEKYNITSYNSIIYVCPDDDVDHFGKNISK